MGVVLTNAQGLIFAGQRADWSEPAWQMPQGGMDEGETPTQAAYRELREETGVRPEHVSLVAETKGWHAYDFPPDIADKRWGGRFRGQTQKWLHLRLTASDDVIDLQYDDVEFSDWKWMSGAMLLELIVAFKRPIYEAVLREFALS